MASSDVDDASPRRVLVVGCPGSGKTTFALKLGELFSLPVIHLDYHFWGAGWQAPSNEVWRERAAALASRPAWVMDGNFSNTFDIRMPRADSLIWLDHTRGVCMRRVLMRVAKNYGRLRPDLPDGCPERIDFEFLRYVWNFRRDERPRIPDAIERFGAHLRVARFGCDSEGENFLAGRGAL